MGITATDLEDELFINKLKQLNEQNRKVIARGIDECKAGSKHVNGKLFLMKRHLNITTVQLEASYGDSKKQVFLQVYLNQTEVINKIQEQDQIFAYFEHLSLVKKEALYRLSRGDFNQASIEIGKRPSAPYLQEIYDNQLEMKSAFKDTVDNIESIITQMQEATMAFSQGNLYATIDALSAKGKYGYLVKTANNAFNVILSYFQTMPVPIRIIDKNYKVIFSNNASSQSGFVTDQSLCHQWFDSKEPCISCPYSDKSKALTIKEITLEQKGKPTYWRVYRKPLLDEQGEIINIIEILIDETQVVQLKKSADSANLAKSTFIANMSHEIRTPMNAILGYSQLMEMSNDLSEENRNYVEIIKRSGNHLLGLINDILELSKIEAGKIPMNQENFHMNTLLSDLQSMFKPQMDSKAIKFHIQEHNIYDDLFGDMGKIRQILINLVNNALKFTSQGEINILAHSLEKDDGKIKFTFDIKDTGCGIAKEEISKVFSAFEQTQSGIKSGSGTGLGMAISRNFALMMDGDLIVLDSQINKGTTFRLTFELNKATQNVKPTQAQGNYENIYGLKTPKTILVIDEIKDSREFLEKVLTKLGFKVICISDNHEALQIVKENTIHCLTTDLCDQKMKSYDLIKILREDEKYKQLPIIVITANAMESDKKAALRSGVNLFLTKPLMVNQLVASLENLIQAQYLYKNSTKPSTIIDQQELKKTSLEEDKKSQIRQAVLQGNFDLVISIAKTIENSTPILATKLIALADEFDKDKIFALLEDIQS